MLLKKLQILYSHVRQKLTYGFLYNIYKDNYRSLHWNQSTSQELRYRVFLQIADLNDQSVADIGCGLGDFYAYLIKQGLNVDFTGFDTTRGFIKTAAAKYPQAQFLNQNIVLTPTDQNYDYIFCCGLFAFGNQSFFKEMIKISFSLCKKGLAFNIYQTKSKGFYHLTPSQARQFCQTLNPKQIILHEDYHNQDYTVFLYK